MHKDTHIYFDRETTTTAEIEAQFLADTLKHSNRLWKIGIAVSFLLIFIFRGFFIYWLKFGFAFQSHEYANPITVQNEPVQTNYPDNEQKLKTFTYTSLLNSHKITVIPVAHYDISCTVVANNYDFLFISDFFDSAALYDLGCAWGKLGDKKYYNANFKSYSTKTELTGTRKLWIQAKRQLTREEYDYAPKHWSHTHIVPANRNIMAALLSIKIWQKVRLEGELVDMKYIGKNGREYEYHTSLSRTDADGAGDRGNGSCETLYLTKIQIENKIYK